VPGGRVSRRPVRERRSRRARRARRASRRTPPGQRGALEHRRPVAPVTGGPLRRPSRRVRPPGGAGRPPGGAGRPSGGAGRPRRGARPHRRRPLLTSDNVIVVATLPRYQCNLILRACISVFDMKIYDRYCH